MNEPDFTDRLETSLERGLALVPLPAREPVNARYRIAAAKIGRRHAPRLTFAIAAVGLALFTSVVAAGASGTSPATVVSGAVHRVVVFVEQMTTPGQPVPPAPPSEPELRPAGVPEPTASGQEPVTTPGDGYRASPPAESPSPAPAAEPSPAPRSEPPTAPMEEPSPAPIEEPAPRPESLS
jgi:hypothetical protein